MPKNNVVCSTIILVNKNKFFFEGYFNIVGLVMTYTVQGSFSDLRLVIQALISGTHNNVISINTYFTTN